MHRGTVEERSELPDRITPNLHSGGRHSETAPEHTFDDGQDDGDGAADDLIRSGGSKGKSVGVLVTRQSVLTTAS